MLRSALYALLGIALVAAVFVFIVIIRFWLFEAAIVAVIVVAGGLLGLEIRDWTDRRRQQ